MKFSALLSTLLLAVMAGGLVVTNPPPNAYELYASEQAEKYLNDEVCNELPSGLSKFIGEECPKIAQKLKPEVERLIRDRTERLNLGVASIYRTSVSIPELIGYEVETVGILGRFITYRAAQTR